MSPNKTPLWMQRWQQLGERDRRAIAWGATLLGLALLWWLALAPAIATLREAPARIATERATVQRIKDMAQYFVKVTFTVECKRNQWQFLGG